MPLEQFFTFFLRFDERFWRETLRLNSGQLKLVRAFGSLPGLVKIERWRGHSVVSFTELLPESRLAISQTRRMEIFSGEGSRVEVLAIGEMPLERRGDSGGKAASLELSIARNSIVLRRPGESDTAGEENSGGCVEGTMLI